MEDTEKLREDIKKLVQEDVHGRTVTMISTALAIVAGLFWQKAINDTLAAYIPVNGAWPYEIGLAIMITVGLAMVISFLNKPIEKKVE